MRGTEGDASAPNKVDMNPFHTDIVDMEEEKIIKEMGWDKSDFNPDDELGKALFG